MANKTYGDIQDYFNNAYCKHSSALSVNEALKVAIEETRVYLIAYYSSPDGKAELSKTRYSDYSVDAAVELLIKDIRIRSGKLKEKERKQGKDK